ncbi:MAG: hypothetical protein AB7O78_11580 [Thermoleophilia bacterium]
MSAWAAAGWGAFSAAALLIGQALARPLASRRTTTGLLMGFGAGTLLAAVAYELIPESSLDQPLRVGIGFALGALTYFLLDWLVDRRGGSGRQDIAGAGGSAGGSSGAAMFIGALLDGIPEAFVLGAGLALGGGVSVAFVVAVFASNIPEGVAGTANLRATGVPEPRTPGCGRRSPSSAPSPRPSASWCPTACPTAAWRRRRSRRGPWSRCWPIR